MFLGPIARAFTGLGSGLAHGIGGFGRKIKKLGESDGPPGVAPGSYSKPPSLTSSSPQNPAATVRQGLRGIEDAVADAERDARGDYGTPKPLPFLDGDPPNLPDLPISRRDLPIPAPAPAPSLASLRTALPSITSRPSPPLAAPPAVPNVVPDLVPDMDLDRRNLPIPRLPGHPGGPTSYNPVDAAEYDYVMRGAKRDAEGNLTGEFARDWKQALLSAGLGAVGGLARTGDVAGAIGGAVAGGAGSLISPSGGREFAFDTLYRPKMEAEMARERAEKDRLAAEIFNQARLDDLRATTEERRAQTRKLGQPAPRQSDVKIGINRRTGMREYFDANDPAQRALYDAYVEPKTPPRGQMRLGRNINTGALGYYDPSDPEQAAAFRPDRLPTPESGKQLRPPGGAVTQINEIKKLKRSAQSAWDLWGKETDPEKKRRQEQTASAAQAAFNDAVATLGESFPDLYETGPGAGGWAYYKPREGGGQAAPQRSSRPTGQRKAVVGADFVQYVADTLKVSPERARQMIEADDYMIK